MPHQAGDFMQATNMKVFLYSVIVMLAYNSVAVQSECDAAKVQKCTKYVTDAVIQLQRAGSNPSSEICSGITKYQDCVKGGCENDPVLTTVSSSLKTLTDACSGSSKAVISTWAIIAAVVAVMFC